jgi:hypothetical protein
LPAERQRMSTQPETCLDCLVSIARHHGIELAVERLRHTYAIADGPILTHCCCASPGKLGCARGLRV